MRSASDTFGTPIPLASSRTYSGRIPPRWLPMLRGAWLVCALLLLANMVASIPAYYQIMSTVCSLPNQGDCTANFGQLTAATVQSLAQLHLSLSAYAAYFVTLDVLVSLLPWGIGLLLFRRKSDEWMGLFVSLLLILVGGNGASNMLAGLWMPSPPSPLFAMLLTLTSAAQWIGFGAFLLTFPTGRFAPRWSWVILVFWITAFLQPSIQPPPSAGPTAAILLPSVFLYLGLGFAILRYRLWDIDTIINRTLVYGTLTAILTLTYVGVILLAHALTQALTKQQTEAPPLVIVGSTLLIIALFNPLRRRIQAFIDHRFYRRKYDAGKILAAFTTTLHTEVDLADLSERLVHVVDETMQPTHSSLWLRSPPPEKN